MSKKVIERNRRLVVVENDNNVSRIRNIRSVLAGVGFWVFKLFYTGRFTSDGFAVTPLTIIINERPYSDDLRPRYITPKQQVEIGLSGLPLFGLAIMMLFTSLISIVPIEITDPVYGALLKLTIFVILITSFAAVCFFLLILRDIDSQFYDEEESINDFDNQ
jgi:hypothetical protein